MRISEAMGRGASIHPPTVGEYAVTDFDGRVTTCAIGAAAVGMYGCREAPEIRLRAGRIASRLNLRPRRVRCPKCEATNSVVTTVMHLNDMHHEPRERIAEWLEGLGL